MTIWDDRILELIQQKEGASVGDLAESEFIDVSQPHVSRRCAKLADHGLLRPLGNGVYMITDRGEQYLDGEISTKEDEPDDISEIEGENSGVQSTDEPQLTDDPEEPGL